MIVVILGNASYCIPDASDIGDNAPITLAPHTVSFCIVPHDFKEKVVSPSLSTLSIEMAARNSILIVAASYGSNFV